MRSNTRTMAYVATAAILIAGCRSMSPLDSHPEVLNVKAFIAVANEAIATLATIDGEATASRMLPKLHSVQRRFAVVRETVDLIPSKPDADFWRAVDHATQVYGSQFDDAEDRLDEQLDRLQGLPGVAGILGEDYFLSERWGYRVSYHAERQEAPQQD